MKSGVIKDFWFILGIDEDEEVAVNGDAADDAGTEDMPPLEGEDEDVSSKMEEVDWVGAQEWCQSIRINLD